MGTTKSFTAVAVLRCRNMQLHSWGGAQTTTYGQDLCHKCDAEMISYHKPSLRVCLQNTGQNTQATGRLMNRVNLLLPGRTGSPFEQCLALEWIQTHLPFANIYTLKNYSCCIMLQKQNVKSTNSL